MPVGSERHMRVEASADTMGSSEAERTLTSVEARILGICTLLSLARGHAFRKVVLFSQGDSEREL